jgi:hypothetical protein
MARWDQKLSEVEREAEPAVLITMTNLPAGNPLANSRSVPEAAARRLMGSVGSRLGRVTSQIDDDATSGRKERSWAAGAAFGLGSE